jgi:hypothetical protein
MKHNNMLKLNQESVKSFHSCLAGRQACKSVIQTNYDIVKADGGELKVETIEGEGCSITILLNDIL